MAGRAVTVNVKGYKEVIRALNRTDKETRKTLKDALKEAAEPVAVTARGLIAKYRGASTSTIQPRVVTKGVFVTQRKRKTTGMRPDFGSLQMRKGMIPALYDHEDDIVEHVDHAIGVLINREGF